MSADFDVRSERRLTCRACPTQYEGQLPDGRLYYFRYRGGRAVLGMGQTQDEAVEDSLRKLDSGEFLTLGDRLGGCLDEDEFEAAADELLRLARR